MKVVGWSQKHSERQVSKLFIPLKIKLTNSKYFENFPNLF